MKLRILLIIGGILLGGIILPKITQAFGVSPMVFDEITLNPGESIKVNFKVVNNEDENKIFYFSTQNFTSDDGEEGKQIFLEKERHISADLSKWIKFEQDSIYVAANDNGNTSVDIIIPTIAQPGGHYSVIWVSETNPKLDDSLNISNNVGILVLVNVRGDIVRQASIKEFKVLNKFYNRLPVEFLSRIENKGTVHFKPKGDIVIKGLFSNEVDKINPNPRGSNVLPNTIRRLDGAIWKKEDKKEIENSFLKELKNEWENFALGSYQAILKVDYGKGENDLLIAESEKFWVFPWHLGIVLGIILLSLFILIVFFGLIFSIVFKKKFDKILDK